MQYVQSLVLLLATASVCQAATLYALKGDATAGVLVQTYDAAAPTSFFANVTRLNDVLYRLEDEGSFKLLACGGGDDAYISATGCDSTAYAKCGVDYAACGLMNPTELCEKCMTPWFTCLVNAGCSDGEYGQAWKDACQAAQCNAAICSPSVYHPDELFFFLDCIDDWRGVANVTMSVGVQFPVSASPVLFNDNMLVGGNLAFAVPKMVRLNPTAIAAYFPGSSKYIAVFTCNSNGQVDVAGEIYLWKAVCVLEVTDPSRKRNTLTIPATEPLIEDGAKMMTYLDRLKNDEPVDSLPNNSATIKTLLPITVCIIVTLVQLFGIM